MKRMNFEAISDIFLQPSNFSADCVLLLLFGKKCCLSPTPKCSASSADSENVKAGQHDCAASQKCSGIKLAPILRLARAYMPEYNIFLRFVLSGINTLRSPMYLKRNYDFGTKLKILIKIMIFFTIWQFWQLVFKNLALKANFLYELLLQPSQDFGICWRRRFPPAI